MKPKILVVEDEMIIAYDIKGILENDYNVTINVRSVDEALIKIEEEQPNLILLDINLRSEKDGTSLGEYLLKKDTIPFVYITSYCDKATLDKVKDTRPYGFIVKPFKAVDLLSTVFLALNTFKHRNVDIMRSQKEIVDDIPYRIKETINYINEHLCEKIEVNDLAEITNWKTHHYIRVFTKFIGVTPYQYILNRRIEKAKILLQDESISITAVSYELGFLSYSNFIHAFKKTTNCTPDAYRKKEILNRKIRS